jgi:hypothetical protein
MRRLDKKGMSAVTHDDVEDKTTLDVISDSLQSKEKLHQKKKSKKPQEKKRSMTEAEAEANNLADSLRNHQMFENHQLSQ